MTQTKALGMAAGLTAFVLVTLGAVFAGPMIAQAASPAPSVDAAGAAQMPQREADYQRLLQQANDQLQQAYDQIAQMQAGSSAQAVDPAGYPVSADLAARLALNLAPGARLVHWPSLVDFQGTVAYEIILDRGPIYIDATTARLLFNGTSPAANASLSSGFSGEHEEDND